MLQTVCREQSEVQRANLLASMRTLPPGDDHIAAGLEAALSNQLSSSLTERHQTEQINLMMLYEATREPAFAASMRDLFGSWRGIVAAVLEQEQAAGRLRDEVDRRALGDILIALPFGLELLELLGGEVVDWHAIVRTLAGAFHHGIVPAGPDSEPGAMVRSISARTGTRSIAQASELESRFFRLASSVAAFAIAAVRDIIGKMEKVMFSAWGRFVYRFRWSVLVAALLAVTISVVGILRFSTALSSNDNVGDYLESLRAMTLMREELPLQKGAGSS